MKKIYYSYSHQCLEDRWLQKPKLRFSMPHEDVVKSDPLSLGSFSKLVEATAHISYFNRGMNLFYRGQGRDYRNHQKGNTFYPTIFRGRLTQPKLDKRFEILQTASSLLVKALDTKSQEDKLPGSHLVRRYQELSWAILQHYEVCHTPLMDFTHSLRVAASFALDGHNRKEGFAYLFGFPSMPDSISYHTNEELLNIRLLSFCPPDARRPYFQEGYVAGHFPSFDIRKKDNILDFNNRLVAKFRLDNSTGKFWGDDFKEISKGALFPDKQDRFYTVCSRIVRQLEKQYGEKYKELL